ncbi:MAG TPA: UDP-N-acetylmuramoyl-L-alanyl-D-glutamate--2,6-diaminopimelate ligase, partial [Candidatus Yonathbacteria bacterium]|nr:UDP-N-acetylmuramoyl-L-alanyl-D-glutamate--2,6-diaminopimelate ligase [Candidatus Yonathbacteria bacterium]
YRFPAKNIRVVGVTGTKGKTTTVELVNTILEEAGYKTAIASTLRIKTGDESKRNLYKMTMPGRFFTQKFLRHAVEEKCDYAIIEVTSEGAKQFRHKFLELDALIVTNISPEHIESHGSY